MTGKIVFYHNPQSRAAIVHWMLEEVGAGYKIRHIDLQKGDNKTPEFLAINPMGKIPVIVTEGTAITEAPAILAWLADAYPKAALAPPLGSPERGTYYRWLF
ncbi:MAG TPA: glutathione S-transferase N-terminal domain-containing protein, partial [Aestuariivirga sp.]|nr:glutathione S-transferase N-terminal domain-containing protein [Aestuariivirga sp.]